LLGQVRIKKRGHPLDAEKCGARLNFFEALSSWRSRVKRLRHPKANRGIFFWSGSPIAVFCRRLQKMQDSLARWGRRRSFSVLNWLADFTEEPG
jgi:hypothetical protein